MFRCTLFLLLCAGSLGFAGIEISTSIESVDKDGTAELMGTFTFRVNGNDFPLASPAQPILIQISLDHNSFLAETLVDQSSMDATLSQPVNLALGLDGQAPVTIVAASSAVRIVRWVADEKSFWLAVTQPTDTWLDAAGMPTSLSVNNRVSFTVGSSARMSDRANDHAASAYPSNLPFNTRANSANEGDFAAAVSTLICGDFSLSNVLVDGSLDSTVSFDVVAFDHTAALGNGFYSTSAATLAGISFNTGDWIARGKARTCTLSTSLTAGVAGAGTGGLLSYQQSVTNDLSCSIPDNSLSTNMFPGSYFNLRITSSNAGFPAVDAAAFDDYPGYVELDTDSLINVDGVDLYQNVNLFYNGTSLPLSAGQLVDQFLSIWYNPANGTSFDVVLTAYIANHDNANDLAPYDGADQKRRCQPSFTAMDSVNFTVVAPAAP